MAAGPELLESERDGCKAESVARGAISVPDFETESEKASGREPHQGLPESGVDAHWQGQPPVHQLSHRSLAIHYKERRVGDDGSLVQKVQNLGLEGESPTGPTEDLGFQPEGQIVDGVGAASVAVRRTSR